MRGGLVPTLSVAPEVRLSAVDPARPCGERLKGFSFQAMLDVCEARYGAGAFTDWAARHHLDALALSTSPWVPVEYCFSLAETVVNERHGGDPQAAAGLGADCAAREINAVFRFVLGFTSPTTLLQLGSRFWRQYYDRSELVVVEAVGDSVQLELRGWALMNAVAASVHCGAMLQWLTCCRAPGARFTALEFAAPGLLKLSAAWGTAANGAPER